MRRTRADGRWRRALRCCATAAWCLDAACRRPARRRTRASDPAVPPGRAPLGGPAQPARSTDRRRAPSPRTPVADPEHAVDPPGPRKGSLRPADMLVYDPDSLERRDDQGDPRARRGRRRRVAGAGPGEHREQGHQRGRRRPRRRTATSPRPSAETAGASGTGSPAASWRSGPALGKKLPPTTRATCGSAATRTPRRCTSAPSRRRSRRSTRSSTRPGSKTLGMKAGNALLISHRSDRAGVAAQADRADRRRPRLGAAARRGRPLRPRHQRPADRVPGRHASPTRSARSTTPCSAAAGSPPTRRGSPRTSRPSDVPILGQVTCNKLIFPQLTAALRRDRRARAGRQDPPRRVRRLLLPAVHRRHHLAVQPLLRAGARPQRAGQPARHGRRDGPDGRVDLQEVGLRLGRRLALHRPDALRDERAGRPALTTPGGCADSAVPAGRG